MGRYRGRIADLSRKIEEIVEPSDVFESNGRPEDTCCAAVYLANYYNAVDHRTIAALSYPARFPSLLDDELALHNIMEKSWDTALPLCAQPA
ncbi:hypothetical protein WOLCODRAFT_156417 [Wolfiporia cocos MD-104 SS10]|uniref:Uncharacterized protein n=1 Tax=Wolfiporia cocos (strain MD-104) TaxID=742152 RepID=A0A2H3JDF5_WOLCO|nr:hypothetical protein WOLCODRAFT_156417 [Wolfiporia cocos MD-104 SS10]